jgi:hypothetical protein
MRRSTRKQGHCSKNPAGFTPASFGRRAKGPLILLFGSMLALSACGGGSSSSSQQSQQGAVLAGNWQFNMTGPPDNSFVGGMQGGFLLQNNGSVTGGVVYSIALPQPPPTPATVCSSGSAAVTGILNGQQVTLNAIAGTQTYALTGTLSADGSTMMGTYTSTDGQGCGTAQTGLQWSATSVNPITGNIQGIFHSTLGGALLNQNFPVTGFLTQGENIGASNATVTGSLNFNGGYPCLNTASVNGQISGNSVVLQIIGSNGLNSGQIGAPAGFSHPSPVVFASSAGGGSLLQGTDGYAVSTKACPGPGALPGDGGNVCLGFGNDTSCLQPITMTPAAITFPPQALGSFAAKQTITLTNSDPAGSTLTNLSLSLQVLPSFFTGFSDFNGVPNFTEQDTCAASPGLSFSLAPQQSCSISVLFSPQQSCPWLPSPIFGGVAPASCPSSLTGKVIVNSPKSADNDTSFVVPVTGLGLSAIVASTPEVDFGAEAVSEASPPQLLSFSNQSVAPIQILPALSGPCLSPLPRPALPGVLPGLQVANTVAADVNTITYFCDTDLVSQLPNFQISADSCTGNVLAPQDSCSLQITFAPQPSTPLTPALDYFLQLNTLECTSNTTMNCEIDSGRFPVELKANVPSPLRMSPGAGLDFGFQQVGQLYPPLKITLFNDPNDPKPGTVNFTGNLASGDYIEKDDCGSSLASGSSCTLTITFNPKIVGFDKGSLTITYSVGQTQTIFLRGFGCQNCLLPPGAEKR